MPYQGVIQDWRYYRGQALTAEEVMSIAINTVADPLSLAESENLRTCQFADEGGDLNFRDVFGHDCAWYQEQRETVPGMCASSEVQDNCPVACSSKTACTQVDL